ncbi:hypothetical protein DFQ28_005594 [Apophysomyces sp. BC1034]|nr:hypothetical protein DFQ30_011300 [Apophysomyces sp. BC1015]KAG0193364.1 hypothetical protein DFQ28_005594 [Apophysomyces sp. BC1034]
MVVLAALSFSGALYALHVVREERVRSHAVAVAALRGKVEHAHRQVRALPELKRQLDELRAALVEPEVMQQMQRIGASAVRAGLLLDSVEPAAEAVAAGPPDGGGVQPVGQQTVRLAASGDFAGAWSFLGSLSALSMIVMPDEVQLKRDGGKLSLRAVLTTYGMTAGSGLTDTGCGRAASVSSIPLPERGPGPGAGQAHDAGVNSAAVGYGDASARIRRAVSPFPTDPFISSGTPLPRVASAGPSALIGMIWSGSRRVAVMRSAAEPRVLVPERSRADSVRGAIGGDAPAATERGGNRARTAPHAGELE